MNITPDQLVADYLKRLADASSRLAPGIRAEVLTDVEDHIRDARATLPHDDAAAIRDILTSLGTPDQIALAARDEAAPRESTPQEYAPDQPRRTVQPTGPDGGRTSGQKLYDALTVSLLAAGSLVVPIVGWLAGAVMLWRGPRWTVREKLLGTLVVPLGPSGFIILPWLIPNGPSTCVGSPPGDIVCTAGPAVQTISYVSTVLYVGAGVFVCVRLAGRAKRAGRDGPTEARRTAATDPDRGGGTIGP